MKSNKIKRNIVLGILFFLPVIFLLFLYPSKHNYTPLDVIQTDVKEITNFSSDASDKIMLKDHITILAFLGETPLENGIAASNLKELVYDKFKGFKKFQIVVAVPYGTEVKIKELKQEINTYEDLKFWHYVYGTPEDIKGLFNSLKFDTVLRPDLSTDVVYIIDTERNQRGRLDGRDEREMKTNKPTYMLTGYDCIDIRDIKNKMSDDLRILFTEYRQKRKGNFDSSSRRAQDLKQSDE
ncbi:MAG: hypothetical protein HKN99_07180 [Winogradskyella sp.]|nr:hypothetical protein [Winogradskyella sp.]